MSKWVIVDELPDGEVKDKLIKIFDEAFSEDRGMSKYYKAEEVEKLLSCGCAYAIRDLLTIDIVQCSECIHNPWNTDYDYTCIWDDDFANRPQTPDDFCSYGERIEK